MTTDQAVARLDAHAARLLVSGNTDTADHYAEMSRQLRGLAMQAAQLPPASAAPARSRSTNAVQQRIIERWFAQDGIDRIDVRPQHDGSVRCFLFGCDVSDDTYVLIAIGNIAFDGDHEVHTPTREQVEKIQPMDGDC